MARIPESREIFFKNVKMDVNFKFFSGDIAELKFDRAVPIKPHVKYALRLRNHGGRTSNGDGGVSSVKGPDGTTFSFTSCSLSFNGTNPTRGQLPQILYFR